MITCLVSKCLFDNDNFEDVRPEGIMAGFKEYHVYLFHRFTVLHFVGESFLNLFGFISFVKKYVNGEKEKVVGGKRKRLNGDEAFVRETDSLLLSSFDSMISISLVQIVRIRLLRYL